MLVLVVGRFSHWASVRWFHASIGERMELEVLATVGNKWNCLVSLFVLFVNKIVADPVDFVGERHASGGRRWARRQHLSHRWTHHPVLGALPRRSRQPDVAGRSPVAPDVALELEAGGDSGEDDGCCIALYLVKFCRIAPSGFLTMRHHRRMPCRVARIA